MKMIEIGNGDIIMGSRDTNFIGTVSPIPDGFWVAIGHPTDRGVLVDSNEWAAFVELVNDVNFFVERQYGQVRD